jgi:hypothetical protein
MAPGFVPGNKTPVWGCPGCGCSDNWQTRTVCRICEHRAPSHVQDKQAAQAKAAKGSQPNSPWKHPSGAWANGPGNAKVDTKTNKIIEQLQKQVEELTRNRAAPAKPDPAEGDDGIEIGKLQSALAACTAALGADAPEAASILQKLEHAKRSRLEARPIGSQTMSAQRNVAKRTKAAEAASSKVIEFAKAFASLKQSLEDARAEEVAANIELSAAKEILDEIHLKAITLRDADTAATIGWGSLPASFKDNPEVAARMEHMSKLADEFNVEAKKFQAAEAAEEEAKLARAPSTPEAPALDDGDIAMVIDASLLNSDDFVEQLLKCAAPSTKDGDAMDTAECRKRIVATLGEQFGKAKKVRSRGGPGDRGLSR